MKQKDHDKSLGNNVVKHFSNYLDKNKYPGWFRMAMAYEMFNQLVYIRQYQNDLKN